MTRVIVDRLLLVVVVIGLLLAVSAIGGAGVSTSLWGIRLSSRTFFRPFAISVAAAVVALHLFEHRAHQMAKLWAAVDRRATTIAVCLSLLSLGLAYRFSAFEANAADQYGYVSQAALWAEGNLTRPVPLAAEAPWPDPVWTLTPLGYRPGLRPLTIVPSYPSGLPIAMAGFIKLVGPAGVFLVVPILGSLAVAMTFLLGRRVAGGTCGLIAAAFLLCSPIFLFQLKEPMSDVPVTAWWLVAIALVTRTTASSALGGGLAASAAILTRPNLVPLAAVLGMFLLSDSSLTVRARFRNASLFAIGVLPGCVAVGVINHMLYGSALQSGYGSNAGLFNVAFLRANLSHYPRWLLETETPFVCLALGAPWLLRDKRPWAERLVWLFLAVSVALFACYAFYLPFESWTFLRFLLPAIPLLLIASSAAIVVLFDRLPSIPAKTLLAALLLVLMAWRWDTATALGFDPVTGHGRRFAVIGEFVRDELPANAVVLSIIHSGSVRYYSGRTTLRWDWLPPEWLDPALAFLRSRGYRPYLLIEDWEQRQFIERFGGHSSLAALDWPPLAVYRGGTRADIFDPDDRSRSIAGERLRTRAIGLAASP